MYTWDVDGGGWGIIWKEVAIVWIKKIKVEHCCAEHVSIVC